MCTHGVLVEVCGNKHGSYLCHRQPNSRLESGEVPRHMHVVAACGPANDIVINSPNHPAIVYGHRGYPHVILRFRQSRYSCWAGTTRRGLSPLVYTVTRMLDGVDAMVHHQKVTIHDCSEAGTLTCWCHWHNTFRNIHHECNTRRACQWEGGQWCVPTNAGTAHEPTRGHTDSAEACCSTLVRQCAPCRVCKGSDACGRARYYCSSLR